MLAPYHLNQTNTTEARMRKYMEMNCIIELMITESGKYFGIV